MSASISLLRSRRKLRENCDDDSEEESNCSIKDVSKKESIEKGARAIAAINMLTVSMVNKLLEERGLDPFGKSVESPSHDDDQPWSTPHRSTSRPSITRSIKENTLGKKSRKSVRFTPDTNRSDSTPEQSCDPDKMELSHTRSVPLSSLKMEPKFTPIRRSTILKANMLRSLENEQDIGLGDNFTCTNENFDSPLPIRNLAISSLAETELFDMSQSNLNVVNSTSDTPKSTHTEPVANLPIEDEIVPKESAADTVSSEDICAEKKETPLTNSKESDQSAEVAGDDQNEFDLKTPVKPKWCHNFDPTSPEHMSPFLKTLLEERAEQSQGKEPCKSFSMLGDAEQQSGLSVLKGVVAFVEVRRADEDRSSGFRWKLKQLGAQVEENFTKKVTHVVFQEGLLSTYRKAKELNVHLVSAFWVMACDESSSRAPEDKYPIEEEEKYSMLAPLKKALRRPKLMSPDLGDGNDEKRLARRLQAIKRRSMKIENTLSPEKEDNAVAHSSKKSPDPKTARTSRKVVAERKAPESSKASSSLMSAWLTGKKSPTAVEATLKTVEPLAAPELRATSVNSPRKKTAYNSPRKATAAYNSPKKATAAYNSPRKTTVTAKSVDPVGSKLNVKPADSPSRSRTTPKIDKIRTPVKKCLPSSSKTSFQSTASIKSTPKKNAALASLLVDASPGKKSQEAMLSPRQAAKSTGKGPLANWLSTNKALPVKRSLGEAFESPADGTSKYKHRKVDARKKIGQVERPSSSALAKSVLKAVDDCESPLKKARKDGTPQKRSPSKTKVEGGKEVKQKSPNKPSPTKSSSKTSVERSSPKKTLSYGTAKTLSQDKAASKKKTPPGKKTVKGKRNDKAQTVMTSHFRVLPASSIGDKVITNEKSCTNKSNRETVTVLKEHRTIKRHRENSDEESVKSFDTVSLPSTSKTITDTEGPESRSAAEERKKDAVNLPDHEWNTCKEPPLTSAGNCIEERGENKCEALTKLSNVLVEPSPTTDVLAEPIASVEEKQDEVVRTSDEVVKPLPFVEVKPQQTEASVTEASHVVTDGMEEPLISLHADEVSTVTDSLPDPMTTLNVQEELCKTADDTAEGILNTNADYELSTATDVLAEPTTTLNADNDFSSATDLVAEPMTTLNADNDLSTEADVMAEMNSNVDEELHADTDLVKPTSVVNTDEELSANTDTMDSISTSNKDEELLAVTDLVKPTSVVNTEELSANTDTMDSISTSNKDEELRADTDLVKPTSVVNTDEELSANTDTIDSISTSNEDEELRADTDLVKSTSVVNTDEELSANTNTMDSISTLNKDEELRTDTDLVEPTANEELSRCAAVLNEEQRTSDLIPGRSSSSSLSNDGEASCDSLSSLQGQTGSESNYETPTKRSRKSVKPVSRQHHYRTRRSMRFAPSDLID